MVVAATKKTVKFAVARDENLDLYLFLESDLDWVNEDGDDEYVWKSKRRKDDDMIALCSDAEDILEKIIGGTVPSNGKVALTLTVDSVEVAEASYKLTKSKLD